MPLLASKITTRAAAPDFSIYEDSRSLQLELLDGTIVIPFDDDDQWIMPGLTGYGLTPRTVNTSKINGVDGGVIDSITVDERAIFLPFYFYATAGHAAYLKMHADLRQLVSLNGQRNTVRSTNGHFNIVARSIVGERLLTCAYTGGLEGDTGQDVEGAFWATLGMNCVAVDPYWRDRYPTVQSYKTTSGGVYIGDGSGSYPFPRRISSSTVVGTDMQIFIDSDVPVAPDLQLVGPADSASYTSADGASVIYTAPIASGETVTIRTGRVKSARTDTGASVWGSLALGPTFPALDPGVNTVSVSLPGATSASRLNLTYFKGWESAW